MKKGLALIALTVFMAGRAHAGAMDDATVPEGESQNPISWNLTGNLASEDTLTALRGFFQTQTGSELVAAEPSFVILSALNPKSDAHRRLAGVLNLPAGFATQLKAALQSKNSTALAEASTEIFSSYVKSDAERKITRAVNEQADKIDTAIVRRQLDIAQLWAAASELSPFVSISERAQEIVKKSNALQQARAVSETTDIIRALMRDTKKAENARRRENELTTSVSEPVESHLSDIKAYRLVAPDWSAGNPVRSADIMAARAPMDFSDMVRLNRYTARWDGDNHDPYFKDSDIHNQYAEGQKFKAEGILTAMHYRRDASNYVTVYLRELDDTLGQRSQAILYTKKIHFGESTRAYMNSLPQGKAVTIDFTINTSNRVKSQPPFDVESVKWPDGRVALTRDALAVNKLSRLAQFFAFFNTHKDRIDRWAAYIGLALVVAILLAIVIFATVTFIQGMSTTYPPDFPVRG